MKELETERLYLRKINYSDTQEMFDNWCNDKEVCKYLPWNIHENIKVTENLVKMWIEEYKNIDTYRWMVVLKETNELLGTIDIVKQDKTNKVYEVGYCYKKSSWNKGYGTEALTRVIKFLFDDIKAYLVYAKHYENNIGSYKVMEKSNMKVEAVLRNRIIFEGKRIGEVYHSITKEEYERLNYDNNNTSL